MIAPTNNWLASALTLVGLSFPQDGAGREAAQAENAKPAGSNSAANKVEPDAESSGKGEIAHPATTPGVPATSATPAVSVGIAVANGPADAPDILKTKCGESRLTLAMPGYEPVGLALEDGKIKGSLLGIPWSVGKYTAAKADQLEIAIDQSVLDKISELLAERSKERGDDTRYDLTTGTVTLKELDGGNIEVITDFQLRTSIASGSIDLRFVSRGLAEDPDGRGGRQPAQIIDHFKDQLFVREKDSQSWIDITAQSPKAPSLLDILRGVKVSFAPHCGRDRPHASFLRELFGG